MHPDKAKQSLLASRATAKPSSKPGAKPTTHVNKPPTRREIKAAEKEASERFTRLGLITEILRGEGRERYDHFLNNGFPKWRGTGYYYARFRPGVGSVLVGLFVVGGGLGHYIALVLGYYRQRDFVKRYIGQAQKAAWGEEGKPSALRNIRGLGAAKEEEEGATVIDDDYEVQEAPRNRRERRLQEKENKKKRKDRDRSRSVDPSSSAATTRETEVTAPVAAGTAAPAPGPKKQVEAENGKILVVDSEGKVFLEEEDEESGDTQLFLLDPEEIERPTYKQTVLWRLPVWLFGLARRRFSGQKQKGEVEETEDSPADAEWEEIENVIEIKEEEVGNASAAKGNLANGDVDAGAIGKKARKRKGRK